MVHHLNLTRENSELLAFLVNSVKEYDFFIDNFWLGEESQFDSIEDYRLHKIKHLSVSLNGFVQMCFYGITAACEILYQQPINSAVEKLLHQKIQNGLTLEKIYKKHSENIGRNILQVLL